MCNVAILCGMNNLLRSARSTRSLRVCTLAVLATLTAIPRTPLLAQEVSQEPPATSHDWWTLGAFGVAVALAAPFDSRIAAQFERPSMHRNRTVANTATTLRTLGDPGVLILSVGAFAIGRLAHRETMADVGLHATEAAVVSGVVTSVLKVMVGRARPYAVINDHAGDFHPFQFDAGFSSFPSGHTTVAFAGASVLSAELARSDFARGHRTVAHVVPSALFATATLVGVSRMYHDAHWGSDVVAGAGIGTVTGAMMVRLQHRGERSTVDKWLLPSAISPVAGGVAVNWRATFR